ncbi:MAG TPA: PD-(D/E)XK nuclease family protein [Acidimicrobiia bacterium]|nr:PD-(D/E)XK nuclease family protein [Acidimicrobiia bacterium]
MPISVVPTTYGRAASQALRDSVARAKEGDALAPVTVVVPTNSVGVSARRRLASGELGPVSGAGRGVVGVTFVTVYRLAELLGAAELAAAGRRPVSTPVVASAVRRALARNAGLFTPVAQHPATEEALVGAHRELADLDAAQLDLLAAQHPRAREVVRLHRATKSLLEREWHDEHDLMRVATDLVSAGTPLVRELGTVVCFLPQRFTAPSARLLRALSEQTRLEIIVGLTGSPTADAQVTATLRRIGAEVADPAKLGIGPEMGTEVWNASDPDDEVRSIVRGVVDAMRAGVALERMAVLYASDEPYARLLHEHFTLADIAHNGATTRSMSESVLGRGLLRLFALVDSGFARDEVCGLFAAAPLLDGRGRPVPAAKWERVSRDAGVVRGIPEWQVRLDRHAATFADDERGARERAQVEALGAFVARLASDLDPGAPARTWKGLAQLAHRLVRRYFGDDSRRASWPPFERVAARRVEAVLDRLATLDPIDPAPSIEVFRRTFELELNAARDRVGSLGDGVLVGPVGMALGVDLDRLWVCGLSEGLFPSVPRDDPLLGDRERAALGGELRLRSDRTAEDERALLAALASTDGPRVCAYPRGDLRRSTEHVPSRFLAATLAAVAPAHSVPSYAYGATHVEFPANRHELEVRAAAGGEAWVGSETAVARGLELTRARADSSFTRFDGNLAHLADRLRSISPAHPERVASPTRLQTWAVCPHAYFMQTVLNASRVEQPEDVMQLAPIVRGTLVHEVLDRFLGEVRERVDAGRPWNSADRARLRAIGEEVCAEIEARGLTGRRLLWHRDRRLILAELDAFLDADEQYRADGVAQTLATELAFGMSEAGSIDAIEVPLGDGRVVRVRGKADRVDRRAGGELVVIDYKTGAERDYRVLNHDAPVTAGQHLQLPVYAYAARAAFGAPDTKVEAYYWFVGRGKNLRIGYDVDDSVRDVFATALRTIVDGIEAGVFPSQPPEPAPTPWVKCHFCDPDGMGTTDRWREWQRKFAAPELDGFRSLAAVGSEGGA